VPGTYVLIVDLARDAAIEVGALGEMEFEAGTYAYVGSAFGPGGFSRVTRHRELAAGDRDARHWHIDYLLGDSAASLAEVVTYPDADLECRLAKDLPGDPVAQFGASDCDCDAHLLAAPDREILAEVAKAEKTVRSE